MHPSTIIPLLITLTLSIPALATDPEVRTYADDEIEMIDDCSNGMPATCEYIPSFTSDGSIIFAQTMTATPTIIAAPTVTDTSTVIDTPTVTDSPIVTETPTTINAPMVTDAHTTAGASATMTAAGVKPSIVQGGAAGKAAVGGTFFTAVVLGVMMGL